MKPPASSRHRSRELALQALVALDFMNRRAECPLSAEGVLDLVAENFEVSAGSRPFARELMEAVAERIDELDERIGARARNWRVERMGVVDRNVLRLGTYELAHTPTPVAVVLDEAVEMARRFGGDHSPAFVNGILDALARDLRPEVGPDVRGGAPAPARGDGSR